MPRSILWLLAFAGLLSAPSSVAAQQSGKASAAPPKTVAKTVTMKEQRPGLKAQAKFPADSARKLAEAKVPGGSVTKEELRQDGGKLLYTFYFKTKGKAGRDAVNVDAVTGAVAAPVHETSDEAKAERKGTAATDKGKRK